MIAVGRIVWLRWYDLALGHGTRPVLVGPDLRVPPASQLSFSGFCLIHTDDVWKRLNDCALDLARRRLITEKHEHAEARRQEAWSGVERRSPYGRTRQGLYPGDRRRTKSSLAVV